MTLSMTTFLPLALSLLLQSTALLLLGLLALRLTLKLGPAVQTLVGRSALAGVVLLVLLAPLTGQVRPLWRVTLEPAPLLEGKGVGVPLAAPSGLAAPYTPAASLSNAASPTDTAQGHDQGMADKSGAAHAKESAASSAPASPIPPPRPSVSPEGFAEQRGPLRSHLLQSKVLGSYLSITLALLLWLWLCQWHLTHLRRTAIILTSGPATALLAELTPHPPQLLTHPAVRSPFLAGLVQPVIFLPPTYAADFDMPALRAILAHELAHRDRHDNAWTLAARLLCALLWFQPLLWLLCRKLEQTAEDACDQAVLASNCPPRTYAACLLTLAERHPLPRRQRVLGAGVAPYRSSLGRRIQRILTQGKPIMLPVSTKLRLTIAAVAFAAAIGGTLLVSSAPAQVSTPILTQAATPAIVGIWRRKSPSIGEIVIFGPQGDAAIIENGGLRCQYYRYALNGSVFTATHTRTEDNGRIVSDSAGPQISTGTYSIANGMLTVHTQYSTARVQRVSAYPEGVPLETVVAQQAGLSASALHWQQSSELNKAEFLAGLTPVQGPGVIVTLRDSKQPFPNTLPSSTLPPNIIHDTDINQVVNELRAAGAEAISVNDQRLVATSAVRTAGPMLFVNNVPQTPPYVIEAIGNPETLNAAVSLPGGIASQIKSYDRTMFSVENAQILTLPAYKGEDGPRYARPAEARPAEARPAEARPAEARPAEARPAEARPAEARPAEANASVPTPQELRYHEAYQQDLQNLKVIGLAIDMYERDNKYRTPDADHWMDQITPYLHQITPY